MSQLECSASACCNLQVIVQEYQVNYDAAVELKNTVVSTAVLTLLTLHYITENLAY